MLDPTEGESKAAIAWYIEKGHFDNNNNNRINLDNLNVAAILYAPGNMFTGPKMAIAVYLDETASNDQKAALTEIFSGKVGGFFGVAADLIEEVLGVKSVPIEFSVEAKRRRIKIPTTTLELEVEVMTGSDSNKESILVIPAFTLAPGYDPVIAHSTKYTYNDHELEWDNTGTMHSTLDSLILLNSISIPIWVYDFYLCLLSLVIDNVNTQTH
ncbi:MAG: DUF1326 domain-containing protein [Thermoproteota archaeon]|nr:DUF1326 domain-containing protein [Thermoproteota archaeon]